jgi:hypothetical protein
VARGGHSEGRPKRRDGEREKHGVIIE